jgi:hypothetical protein
MTVGLLVPIDCDEHAPVGSTDEGQEPVSTVTV